MSAPLEEILERLRDLVSTYRRNRLEDADNYAWKIAADDLAALVREFDRRENHFIER